jgi:ATP-dependent HslUV protease ATP-binding subunit HslU
MSRRDAPHPAERTSEALRAWTPRRIVEDLDRHIVGQAQAKRSVAIALRNRWRRQQVAPPLRDEISPKNIILVGPTGSGKTEIARRLAKLAGAPFLKVEVSKFTEVGYVGRDVDSIVRELVEIAAQMARARLEQEVQGEARARAEDRILDAMLPSAATGAAGGAQGGAGNSSTGPLTTGPFTTGPITSRAGTTTITVSADGVATTATGHSSERASAHSTGSTAGSTASASAGASASPPTSATASTATRDRLRVLLREGKLDEREIEVEVDDEDGGSNPLAALAGGGAGGMGPLGAGGAAGGAFGPGGMGDGGFGQQLKDLLGGFGRRATKRALTVAAARARLTQQEAARLVDRERLRQAAVELAEQAGIVFLDEIDKICGREGARGADVSREGVQRDLLPIVEGSTVATRYGNVRTDHVLFIAAGAFHVAKVSDLIPELQGRFPIRVELAPLGREEFIRILKDTEHSLLEQYAALLGAEGVRVVFDDAAVAAIADVAASANASLENIGARRLHTVLERVLEELSYEASEVGAQEIRITASYVSARIGELLGDTDLARHIL